MYKKFILSLLGVCPSFAKADVLVIYVVDYVCAQHDE